MGLLISEKLGVSADYPEGRALKHSPGTPAQVIAIQLTGAL